MKKTIKTLSVLLLTASAFQVSKFSNQASAGFGFDKPGWGVGLDPTVGPKLPRPPAALSINVFEYDINTMRCAFARQNDGAWVEFQGNVRHRFAEVARNSEFIELFDPSRNIRVRLYRNHSTANFYGRGWQHLYFGVAR